MSTVAELVTKLGFKVDNNGLSGYQKSLDNIVNKAKQIALVYLSFTGIKSFFGMIKHTADAADALDDLSRSIGLTANQLEKLSFIAGTVGISQEGVIQTIGIFNKKLGEAKLGAKEAIDTFSNLGIDPKKFKDSSSAFIAVTKAIGKIKDENIQAAYAMDIFGKSGKSWLSIIRDSPEKVEKLSKKFEALHGSISQKFLDDSGRFGDNISLLSAAFDGFKNTITGILLPVLNEIIESFLDWYELNKKIIDKSLLKFFNVFSSVLKRVGSDISFILKYLYKLRTVLIPLAGFLIGAFAPWLAIWSVIILIIDDFISYLQGNDSLIGRFLNLKYVKSFIFWIKKAWSYIRDFYYWLTHATWGELTDALLNAFSIAWEKIKLGAQNLIDWLFNKFSSLSDRIFGPSIFSDKNTKIIDKYNSKDKDKNKNKKTFNNINEKILYEFNQKQQNFDFLKLIDLAKSNILAATAGPSIRSPGSNSAIIPVSNNNDLKYQPTITVNVGATSDPKQIADIVNKSQKSVFDAMLRDAFRSTQGGLR